MFVWPFVQRKIGSLALLLVFPIALIAQIEKATITVAPFHHDTVGKRFDQYMVDCRSAALRSLLASGRFTVLDRDAAKEVEHERKLQKSESFIDGKVVEQGKAIGAEYILTGRMSAKTGILSIAIVSVANDSKVEGGDCMLREGFFSSASGLPPSYTTGRVQQTMREILSRWLAKDRYTVVRSLEGDEKETEKILLAAGSTRGIRKGAKMEVFYTTTETVDSIAYERDVSLGRGEVIKVENANFSVVKIQKGKKNIASSINEKQKLYCRLRND